MKKIILLLTLIVGVFNINAQSSTCNDLEFSVMMGDPFSPDQTILDLACSLSCDFVVNTPCGCYTWENMTYGDDSLCPAVETFSQYDSDIIATASTVYFIISSGANNSYSLTANNVDNITIYVGSGNGNSLTIYYIGTMPSVNQVIGSGNGATWNLISLATPGCTDVNACNYDATATEDDGTCEYAAEGYDCDGNCTLDVDCNGECGGTATLDDCGVCDGTDDCLDQCGVPNGTDDCLDECGVPNGGGIPEGACDCAGNDFTVYYSDPNCESVLTEVTLVNDFCGTSSSPIYGVPCGTDYEALTSYTTPYMEDSFTLTPTTGEYLFYGSFEIQNGAEIMLTLDDGGLFNLIDIPNPQIESTVPWNPDGDGPVASLTIIGSNAAYVVIEENSWGFSNIEGLFNNVEWVKLISTNAKVHLDNGIILSYIPVCDVAISDVCGNCNTDINNDNICDELQEYDCCNVLGGDGSTCNGVCGACNDDTSCLDECGVPNGDGPASGANCNGDCLEGYTQLTLMWSGAVDASMMTSFSVSGSANGELYSATIDTDSGSMTECWMTDLQADCFSIEIEGPDGLEWSMYSPLSDDPFLTGTNESMVMGSECTMGCMDMDACNYDSSAQMDDGSCEYADSNADCNGDCLEGYTELTLMWSGAVDASMMTSFSVSGSANGELYSATLDTDSGSMTECWMTDLQADCFSIEIEGPDGLEWSIYSPLSDDPFLIGTNESMVFGSQCLEIWGCTDLEACNYNELATDDDGSCVVPAFENNIQCDECCMYSVGAWTHVNAFYLASSDTPTLSAFAENWELSSAAFLYSEETINEDGSVSTTSWFGADSDNSSMLTGDCYNGQITLVLIFKTIDNNIVGDIVIKMFDDGDMYFETITSVDSFDLTTATMTGTIEAGNSGTLVMVDSDGNGVGDCDESTSIQEGSVSDRKLVKKINLLGQEVEISNKRGVFLYIYDDGTVEKKNQLR